MSYVRFGGGSFGFPLPNNLFILVWKYNNVKTWWMVQKSEKKNHNKIIFNQYDKSKQVEM